MPKEFQIRAGLLLNHMKRASFCTDIRDIVLEINDGIMKTGAVGAANDRIAIIRTSLGNTEESFDTLGIPNIYKVIDKIGNFRPEDMVWLKIDENNQMKVIRTKPKKTYTISTVEDITQIRSKSIYDIWADVDTMEMCLRIGDKPTQKAGNIKAILKIPNLSEAQKLFKSKDVFTDEVELTIFPEGNIEIMGRDEDDIGADFFEVEPIVKPERKISSGYSGLIEVIKALNPKADITIYIGDGTMSLMIVEKYESPEETYESIYIVMPRILRWR